MTALRALFDTLILPDYMQSNADGTGLRASTVVRDLTFMDHTPT
jgi:hypothetical protein